MKKTTYIFYLLILLFISIPAYPQVAIIPYKIKKPVLHFNEKTGEEYAKILGVVLAVKKKIATRPAAEIKNKLKALSISPQADISKEDLARLSRKLKTELIVCGTLSKAGGSYVSECFLYSSAQKRIILKRTVKAGSIYSLAEMEIGELFTDYPGVEALRDTDLAIDIAFLADISYHISQDWQSVKKGIKDSARCISDNGDADARFYLLPFSDAQDLPEKAIQPYSYAGLRDELDSLNPKGENRGRQFENAFSCAIGRIRWRQDSIRALIVISNSEIKNESLMERYAHNARSRNIKIYTISLGRQNFADAKAMRELALIGRGRAFQSAYHERVTDGSGRGIDLFMEIGRFFHSDGSAGTGKWKNGLFEKLNEDNFRLAKPKSFLNELLPDGLNTDLNPYSMVRLYEKFTGIRITKTGPLESNVDVIFKNICDLSFGSSGKSASGSIARVNIADGRNSVWINIDSRADLELFKKKKKQNSVFPLGIMIHRRGDSSDSLKFSRKYITRFSKEFIPDMIKTSLGDIAEKPAWYAEHGLMKPPVWFINVTVRSIEIAGDRAEKKSKAGEKNKKR